MSSASKVVFINVSTIFSATFSVINLAGKEMALVIVLSLVGLFLHSNKGRISHFGVY